MVPAVVTHLGSGRVPGRPALATRRAAALRSRRPRSDGRTCGPATGRATAGRDRSDRRTACASRACRGHVAPAGHTPDGDPHRPVIEEHEPLLRRLGVGQRVLPRVERVDAAEVLHRGPWAVDEAARLQLPRAGQTVPTRHDASAGPCGLSTTRHTRQPRSGSRVASRGRRGRARPPSQVVSLAAPPAPAQRRVRAALRPADRAAARSGPAAQRGGRRLSGLDPARVRPRVLVGVFGVFQPRHVTRFFADGCGVSNAPGTPRIRGVPSGSLTSPARHPG